MSNESKATGGHSNVNINGSDSGQSISNVIQAFALDIPRQVCGAVRLWGVALLIVIFMGLGFLGAASWAKMCTLEAYLEAQSKSLQNMHDKYNRMTRYIKTNDPSAFNKNGKKSDDE